MGIEFQVGKQISPSGFGLAVVDIPPLDPEKNISLIDTSYKWEENVANLDSGVIKAYVNQSGAMPMITVTDFVVTNIVSQATNDVETAPLYYKHDCRFHHYSYGENPTKNVYITDQNENILKGINYLISIERIAENVYTVDVFTDFQNNEYITYKVKYNRCLEDGSQIYPSWTETLNAHNLFKSGSPFVNTYEYSLVGPTDSGLYTCLVPPVPTLTELTNGKGLSFENSPTIVKQDVTYIADYIYSVRYTLKATGTTTFTIQRNKNRLTGATATDYLTSTTSESWGSATNFDIGTVITALPGVYLKVYGDNYLNTNDEAYFNASRAYYYLKPIAYNAIYLKKPTHVTSQDDWYIRIKNGSFRRRMADGVVVPSGQGTLWEYGIPEYDEQMFDLSKGSPYKESINERVEILDSQTIQLQRTPFYVDPSDVFFNTEASGFPPSGSIYININDVGLSQNNILDWDERNGIVRVSQLLSHGDDVLADYLYEEKFYEYTGFYGSGGIYTSVAPLPFDELDLNPTPSHNFEMYASGIVAHVFIKPFRNIDTARTVYNKVVYHNFTGTASGVHDFKLGSISLGPACKIDDVEIIDVRTRGGGLSTLGVEEIEDVKDVQPEAEFFWDTGYFDGKAFPSNGVLVIDVPKSVLSTNGGQFTEDEVRVRVLKHMALGEYPILNFI